ncbi:hypothetical protein LZ32DRAFT_615913 [Colletotrichum eremochloae]|nr:hypothetical protein LZ32DRAFT_615913 [Colletotrichum eremochloae]
MSSKLELEGETCVNTDDVIEIKEESPAPESPAVHDIEASEKIFFLKRFVDDHPRLDVLLDIGAGRLHPGTKQEEFAIWQASEDVYIYRKAGPEINLLQSIGSVEYEDIVSKVSKVKHMFAQKTCGFVAARDCDGQLQVLKLAISGSSFHPHRDQDKKNFTYHAKWLARAKHFAKLMKINLRTIYDGHGRQTKAENIGNWRAGHVEKKLSTHIVWTFLAMHGLVDKTRRVSLEDFRQLRLRLREKGWTPRFEIHLSRAPCGTSTRAGQCVPFIRKLTQLTGVGFTIHSWEENIILDGSVPAKQKKREVEKFGPQDRAESPYDSEASDLDAFLDEIEAQTNIVFDGFEEVMTPLRIPRKAVQQFRKSIHKFKRQPDKIIKPYPPTPAREDQFRQIDPYRRASSQSHYWEDRQTPLRSRRQSAASEDKRERRARKHEMRRRRAAASVSEATQHSAEMSVLASRLGSLLNSTRQLR